AGSPTTIHDHRTWHAVLTGFVNSLRRSVRIDATIAEWSPCNNTLPPPLSTSREHLYERGNCCGGCERRSGQRRASLKACATPELKTLRANSVLEVHLELEQTR